MPFFSTDTVAAQRALETSARCVLMGKNGVDGVYDADPRTHPDADKFDALTYDECLPAACKVADATAFSAVHGEHAADDRVRHGDRGQHRSRSSQGERIGTLVSAG